jgi:hypothetical protein
VWIFPQALSFTSDKRTPFTWLSPWYTKLEVPSAGHQTIKCEPTIAEAEATKAKETITAGISQTIDVSGLTELF